MAGRFWNTLAVEDIERSRTFYEALGFKVRNAPGGASSITVWVDDAPLVCLFPKQIFARMVPGGVCDTAKAHELVQSYAAESRAQVDALVGKAAGAGGRAIGSPGEQPFGYAGGFADPDGHVWAVLHMPGMA